MAEVRGKHTGDVNAMHLLKHPCTLYLEPEEQAGQDLFSGKKEGNWGVPMIHNDIVFY